MSAAEAAPTVGVIAESAAVEEVGVQEPPVEPGGSGFGSQIEDFESSVESMDATEAIDEFASEKGAAEVSEEKNKVGIVHGAMVKTKKKMAKSKQERLQQKRHLSPCPLILAEELPLGSLMLRPCFLPAGGC